MKKVAKKSLKSKSQNDWLGASEVKQPEYLSDISFPEDITQINAAEVSKLHARYSALQSYALSEKAKVDVEILAKESERHNTITRKRYSLSTLPSTKQWEQKSIVDHSALGIEEELVPLKRKQIVIQSRIEIFERYIVALSREMTRRMSERA